VEEFHWLALSVRKGVTPSQGGLCWHGGP
jgi:hypothetical protein